MTFLPFAVAIVSWALLHRQSRLPGWGWIGQAPSLLTIHIRIGLVGLEKFIDDLEKIGAAVKQAHLSLTGLQKAFYAIPPPPLIRYGAPHAEVIGGAQDGLDLEVRSADITIAREEP